MTVGFSPLALCCSDWDLFGKRTPEKARIFRRHPSSCPAAEGAAEWCFWCLHAQINALRHSSVAKTMKCNDHQIAIGRRKGDLQEYVDRVLAVGYADAELGY